MRTVNGTDQFCAKGEAVYGLIRELLVQSFRISEIKQQVMDEVMSYLGTKENKRSNAIDLTEIFHFILSDRYVLMIPKSRFGENDFLILRNRHSQEKVEIELVEFNSTSFKTTPVVYLPGYVRRCLKRGL